MVVTREPFPQDPDARLTRTLALYPRGKLMGTPGIPAESSGTTAGLFADGQKSSETTDNHIQL